MPRGIYLHKKGYKRPPISDEWRENLRKSHLGQKSWNKGIFACRSRASEKQCARFIVSNILGRKLNNKEPVHHVDGNRKNTKVENFQYFRNHSAHKRLHLFAKRHSINMKLLRVPWEELYGAVQ